LAEADWKTKFKAALDLTDNDTKRHYDSLLDLRAQIRNFMAHGAFGKRGEAFSFHSGAGAVPVLLSGSQEHPYSLTRKSEFDEAAAITEIENFIDHLWLGSRGAAKVYVFSGLPTILTHAVDGTYAHVMSSHAHMTEHVEHLVAEVDRAANMDW
jgi:hypothetical protein